VEPQVRDTEGAGGGGGLVPVTQSERAIIIAATALVDQAVTL
jgi:hypothetical protein